MSDQFQRGDTLIYNGYAYVVQKVHWLGLEVDHPQGGTFLIHRWERFTKGAFRG